MAELIVSGARQHNLKNISLRLPRDQLVVVTGPSGSGKSSLAFDTIYAEAQRRYVESLSVYARQFLGQMPKPDVDAIEGLSPAICVRQQGVQRSPRSTVGTLTEIYDYLRLLYARAGIAHSPTTGKEMRAFSVDQAVDKLLALPEDTRLTIGAPLARAQREGLDKQLARLRKEGFVRVALNGVVHDLGEEVALDPRRAYDLEVHVDRVRVKGSARKRISEAVELAYKLSSGVLHAFSAEGFDWIASERLMCVDSGESFPALSPRTFSFNSPDGACPVCEGLGETFEIDPDLVVSDPSLSIREGAIQIWGAVGGPYYQAKLEALIDAGGVDVEVAFESLSKAQQRRVLFGDAAARPSKSRSKQPAADTAWEGVIPALSRTKAALRREPKVAREREAALSLDEDLSRFGRTAACPECHGSRLSALARGVTIDGMSLPELSARPLSQLASFFAQLTLSAHVEQVVARVLQDIEARVAALLDLGLDYLALERSMTSLSGGEIERIRLATQFGSGLLGVLYVLDEPSAGLHARDNERLINSLLRLRQQGNSLLVVEHDEAIIRAADFVLDMGEGAGAHGGRVMAAGTLAEVMQSERSPTGRYLVGATPSEPSQGRVRSEFLAISGAKLHNLKDVSVRFPIAALSCVSGVSGSGKSSLLIDTLLPAVRAQLGRRALPVPVELRGAEAFDRVIDMDQAPIGRSPRSNPASYLGAFDDIRELFATLPDARAQGWGAARFSFNVKGGRCEVCKGDGVMRIDMQFLPDTFVRCESCGGLRYNRETLEVRYRGYSIADVLDLSAEAALALFQVIPKLSAKLSALCDVGLGYVALGQPSSTLSGGESQRVKLARELARRTTGRTLLVLDEPTTGLHFQDVALLLRLLQRLVDAGNTVIVIEHHMDVIKAADFVLDMGPEGGPGGGEVVASGTPAELARHPTSHTARYLRESLARRSL
jgi:excinuclease ABC subunit A